MNFSLQLLFIKRLSLLLFLLVPAMGAKKASSDQVERISFNGQTWTELADSFGEQNIIQPALEQRLGIKIITRAAGGSCIANGFDDAEGDRHHRPSFIERLPDAIKDTSKYILMVTGGNDWNYSVPIGNPTDTIQTSYYGALNYIADQTIRANKKAIWVTMIQRNTVKHGGKVVGSANYQDQKQYADAMQKVGRRYGIKVIDAFANSGITFANSSTYTIDGAHPVTAAGKTLYSDFIANEILK
jgi:hypothetical protein